MGKSKCKKARRNRVCPTGLPSVKELENEEEMESSSFEITALTNSVEHIIDLLQSPGVEDKECGAYSIANLANQPSVVPVLLRSNITKILGPLLVDPSSAVRHSVSGALRNLTACGGHDVCDVMVEEDIMTPLVALLKTYEKPWHPVVASSGEKIDSQTEIYIQAVHLLWNLCESSSIALSVFNKEKLLPVLTQCLCVSTYGTDVVVAVAQCLHTVSEDNEEAILFLNTPSVLASLQSLLISTEDSPAHYLLRALSAGILLNTYGGQLSRSPPTVSSMMTGMFETTLNVSCSTLIDLVVKQICNIKERNQKSSKDNIDKFEKREPELEKYCSQCSDMLTAKQIILELLTNICCSDDPDDWEEMDSSDTGSEEVMIDDEMEMSECWEDKSKTIESYIPREIQEAILVRGLLGKILDHLQLPEASVAVLKECSKGQDVLKKIHTVKCRALLSIHNIVQGLDKGEKGTVGQIYPIWAHLAQLAFKQTDFSDIELLEAATSALRAITQMLASAEDAGQLFQETSASDMQLLFQVGHQCSEETIRVNVVRIVGTIGCVLASPKMDGSCTLIKNIGSFLLEMILKDPHLWVVAEALDCIFDVFGEDHLDPVAKEILLVDKLKTFLPILKGKINQQKKTLGRHQPVIATAKTNLHRFIQYKTKPK